MAHNLATINGGVAFAYNEKQGTRPWHKLGTAVPGPMKTREAIILGRLDWSVGTSDMFAPESMAIGPKGEMIQRLPIKADSYKMTFRQDNNQFLGIVGADYKVIQNVEAFEFFDSALGKDAACIDTVGALGQNGARIFIAAKMPEAMEVVPGDTVEYHLILTTAHDGSGAVKVFFSPIRVVCQNTLNMSLRGCSHLVSIKHTKNAKVALEQAPNLLKKSAKYWEKAQAAFKKMAGEQMDPAAVKKFLKDLFPSKTVEDEETGEESEVPDSQRVENIRIRIETLFDGQATGSDLAGKTKWGMYNALTHWIGKERTVRTRKDGTKPDLWEAEMFGLGAVLRQRASELLLT